MWTRFKKKERENRSFEQNDVYGKNVSFLCLFDKRAEIWPYIFNSHRTNWPLCFGWFCERMLMGLKTYIIGRFAKSLAQRCTSWCRRARDCVQTLDVDPKDIMCLVDDMVVGVQAPRQESLEEPASSPFCGSCSSNHKRPNHEIVLILDTYVYVCM